MFFLWNSDKKTRQGSFCYNKFRKKMPESDEMQKGVDTGTWSTPFVCYASVRGCGLKLFKVHV